jgi:hypothetical protein
MNCRIIARIEDMAHSIDQSPILLYPTGLAAAAAAASSSGASHLLLFWRPLGALGRGGLDFSHLQLQLMGHHWRSFSMAKGAMAPPGFAIFALNEQ